MFIDREDELNTLERLVEINVSVIVYGLRGIGKTTILKNKRAFWTKNIETLFIDGYAISNPIDLAKLLSTQETNENFWILYLYISTRKIEPLSESLRNK